MPVGPLTRHPFSKGEFDYMERLQCLDEMHRSMLVGDAAKAAWLDRWHRHLELLLK